MSSAEPIVSAHEEEEGLRILLVRRTRLALLLMFFAGMGFTVLELVTAPTLGPHTVVKLFGLATILLGLQLSRLPWIERHALGYSILVIGVGYSLTVLSGMLSPSREYATSALVIVAASFMVATVFPWGAGPQAVSVLIAVVTLLAGVLVADGNLGILWDDPGAAVVLALMASIVLAREARLTRRQLRTQNRQRQAAEAEIRAFNSTLEERVRERTIALAESNRRLEEESDRARRRQEELARVQRVHLVGQMAAALAHEIHQPLGAIANYAAGAAHRLRSGKYEPAEIGDVLLKISQEAVRGGEILRELRRLTNRHATAMELVDVGAVARDAARVVEHLARSLSVQVDVAIPAGARIIGDPVQLEQVLINLLVNAVEAAASAAAPARRVEVSATAAGKEIIVRVRDTGPGIDPADAAKLFSPFYSTKPDGLGMGLAISRAIAEAHGGSLVALPERRRGAELLLSLPSAAPLEAPPAARGDDAREHEARSPAAAGRSGPSVA